MSTGFSKREVRGLLWLLPALAVVSWLVWEISRAPRVDDAPLPPVEADSLNLERTNLDEVVADGEARDSLPELFEFDPNTVEYHDLVRLGFTRGEALGIVKYRERGKVFEIPEDFAACYQVSEEMYRRLRPYITIGERFRLKKFERREPVSTPISRQSNPPVFVSGVADGAPTEGGRDGIVQGVQPVSATEEVRRMRPNHGNREILVDLNTADSAMLIAVRGIGQKTVMSIIEYREQLGGFADVEQLAEVRGVTEQNFEMMTRQIYVDPAVIQKIDINFAPAKFLARHPYISAVALRKLLKQRQLKGGWRTPEELAEDHIFTAEELTKLGPYLIFK